MSAISMTDILGGIAANVQIIQQSVNKLSTQSVSKAGTPTERIKKNITEKSSGVSDVSSLLKVVKDVKVTDIAKISIIPFNAIATKISLFNAKLGALDKNTISNAKNVVNTTISLLSYLEKANVVRMGIGLTLFPSKKLRKVLIGDGKTAGLVKLLEEIGTSNFAKKNVTSQTQSVIRTIDTMFTTLSKIPSAGIAIKLKMFPQKSLNKFIQNILKLSDELKKLDNNSIKSASDKTTSVSNIMKNILNTAKFASKSIGPLLLGTTATKSSKKFINGISDLLSHISKIKQNVLKDSADNTKHILIISEFIVNAAKAMSMKGMIFSSATKNVSQSKKFVDSFINLVDKIGKTKENSLKSALEKTSVIDRISNTLLLSANKTAKGVLTFKIASKSTTLAQMFMGSFVELLLIITKINKNKSRDSVSISQDILTIMSNLVEAAGETGKGILKFKLAASGIKGAIKFLKDFNSLIKEFVGKKTDTDIKGAKKTMSKMRSISSDMMKTLLTTAALGPIAIVAVPIGIVGLTGIIAISAMYNFVGKMLGSVVGKYNTIRTIINIKSLLTVASGLGILALATIGVGALVTSLGGAPAISIGLITMAGTILLYGGIIKLMKIVGGTGPGTKKSLASILMVTAGCMLLVGATSKLGNYIEENGGIKQILTGLGGVASVMLTYGAIAFLSGSLKQTMVKGIVGMLMVGLVGAMSIGLLMGTVKVASYAKENGGWKGLLNGIGQVTTAVTAYGLLGAAAGALVMGPQALIFAAGLGAMTMLYVLASEATSLTKKTVEVTEAVKKAGGDKALKSGLSSIRNTIAYMTGKEFLSAFAMSPKSYLSAMASIPLLNGLIGTLGKFSKVLSAFGGEAGYLKSISGYDKDGNPIFDKKGVEIISTSKNITDGFTYFTTNILSKLSEISGLTKAAKSGIVITGMMAPVNMFVDILSRFKTTSDGKINLLRFDKKGNVIGDGTPVDIPSIATNIGNGFALFASTILTSINKTQSSIKDLGKAAVIQAMINPVTNFINILKSFSVDENGNIHIVTMNEDGSPNVGDKVNVANVGKLIGTSFESFIKSIESAFTSIDVSSASILKLITSSSKFNKVLGNVSKFVELFDEYDLNESKATNMNKTLPSIGSAIGGFLSELTKTKNISSVKEVKQISKMLNPILKIVRSVSKSMSKLDLTPETASSLKDVITNIGISVSSLISSVSGTNSKLLKKSQLKDVESLVDIAVLFASKLGKLDMTKERSNELLSITQNISSAIENTLNPIIGKNGKEIENTIKVLDKNHISYITKMSNAMKSAKSTTQEYIDTMKELVEVYEKITKYTDNNGNMVMNIDKHVEHHNDVNMSDEVFVNMYDTVIPKIQSAIHAAVSDAIDGAIVNIPSKLNERGGDATIRL